MPQAEDFPYQEADELHEVAKLCRHLGKYVVLHYFMVLEKRCTKNY